MNVRQLIYEKRGDGLGVFSYFPSMKSFLELADRFAGTGTREFRKY
jgi:hypothetical protein